MKKILIFSVVYYPNFVGGAEVAIKEITDRISSDDFEFDMITLRIDSSLPKFEKIGNINVYRIGWSINDKSKKLKWYISLNKYLFPFLGFIKGVRLKNKKNYSAIWSIMASYNSFAALFLKILNPKIKFILTLQEGDPISYIKKRALPVYPFFKMIFKKADFIQAISYFLAKWSKEMGSSCPVHVIPNAVNIDLFSKKISIQEKKHFEEKLEKEYSDDFIITTSRLVKKNAVGDIIDSLIYLPNNIKFLILGDGEQDFLLKEKVKKLKLNSRVKFLGYIPHNEMYKYMNLSKVFIRPSISEGLGNSFLEAMCADLPVIATPVGGIIDFLVDRETGLFCEVSNPKSIADNVSLLLKDNKLREKIIRNAKEMVINKYDWNKITYDIQKNIFELI